jgi:hypothetical protein
MGELEPWIDENFVRNLWFQMGEQVSVKMIRDKFSGYVTSPCQSRQQFSNEFAAAMPATASLIFLLRKLLPRLCSSMASLCPTLSVNSSSTGLAVVVLLIDGKRLYRDCHVVR